MTCGCKKKPLKEGTLDNQGQPNIIDYADKNPLLFSLQDKTISRGYPGKIITSNEPSRDSPDREIKHGPGAATGATAVGDNHSNPSLPTGAPLKFKKIGFITQNNEAHDIVSALRKGIKVEREHTKDDLIAAKIAADHLRENPHYYDYLDQMEQQMKKDMQETVSIPGSLSLRKIGLSEALQADIITEGGYSHVEGKSANELLLDEFQYQEAENIDQTMPISDIWKGSGMNFMESPLHLQKLFLQQDSITEDSEQGLKDVVVAGGIPPEEVPGEEILESIGKPIDDKSDTGDDQTRSTSNAPADNYNSTILETDGPVKTHLHNMTPDYQITEDHISGDVVTGYQEGAKIKRAAKTLLEYEQEELDALDEQGLEIVKMLQYVYNSGEDCKICKALHNTIWREDDPRRPILPSEGLGEKFYNTHPNCKCSYLDLGLKIVPKDLAASKHGRPLANKVQEVADERARITDEYLYPLKEALMMHHIQPDEFPWIPQEVRLKMKNHEDKGRILLIVAAGPSITDHRVEGEKLRRMWTEDLMKKMTYTAVGKGRDINHMIPCRDPKGGFIYDAEWNETKKRMEFIVWESDEEILQAIRDNIITSVSINTGEPRTIDKVCYDDECFMQPSGTILGEANGVAFAYIVTKEGWRYNGRPMRAIPPGIKYTKIYLLE